MHLPTTEDMVRSWINARGEVEHVEKLLSEARTRVENAANVLGARMDPGDMAEGEKIAVWVRTGRKTERLLVIEKTAPETYRLSWRGQDRDEKP